MESSMTTTRKRKPRPFTVRMIKIVISTSEGRTESRIKAPHATKAMLDAANKAVLAMFDQAPK
jgi:hypothetical protein